MSLSPGLLRDLAGIVGEAGIVCSAADARRYECDPRSPPGRALIVVRPACTPDLASLVRYCVRREVPIVPQGANTGLTGSGIADESGTQLIVSLERLRRIESLDTHERVVSALSGTRLSELNSVGSRSGLFFPIELAADPSLGGMVATNTGGARLLRYGDVQRNLLGLEVVLADDEATILTDMTGLRKDNSGPDIKQLFVGTSGCFGIISRVQLELHRLPRQTAVALVVPATEDAVPELSSALEAMAGEFLTAVEGMSANAMELALAHNRNLRNPFSSGPLPDYVLLVELSSTMPLDRIDVGEVLANVLDRVGQGAGAPVADAYFGRPEDVWGIRHSISEGLRAAGPVIGFDLSVARTKLPAMRRELSGLVADAYPQLRVCDFGHCADGGIHFNLIWPGRATSWEPGFVQAMRELIYDRVVGKFGGSFSAEHGIGPNNIAYYRRYASPAARALARRVKSLCDPKGILGRVDFG
jgi:FAD/FMN-containing dehydrogenase